MELQICTPPSPGCRGGAFLQLFGSNRLTYTISGAKTPCSPWCYSLALVLRSYFSNGYPMKKKKILIVEDNPDLSKVLELLLKSPYDTISANNGEEAVDMAVTEVPDLIIMDLMMPEMNGFEAARLIRQVPKTRSIPILAITAGLSNRIEEECSRIGFEDFMAKPFTYEQLIPRIRKLLKQYGTYTRRHPEQSL